MFNVYVLISRHALGLSAVPPPLWCCSTEEDDIYLLIYLNIFTFYKKVINDICRCLFVFMDILD